MADMCAPLQVYIVISIISVITYLINMFTSLQVRQVKNPSDLYLRVQSERHGYMALAVKILFIILFGYLVQVMCDNKLEKVAWVVMFLPFVLFLFIVLYAMSIGAIMAVRGRTGLLAGSAN
tara:strand:- start:99 stop:461 length:363 start_codon:yes stop_codon:yes gene_type:complete